MLKILVVDRERAVLEMLTTAFAQRGWGVETAAGEPEGIAKFERERFDLVLAKVGPSGAYPGSGLLAHIRRSQWPATPTLAVTGVPGVTVLPGYDHLLAIPLSLESLCNTVCRLAEGKKPGAGNG